MFFCYCGFFSPFLSLSLSLSLSLFSLPVLKFRVKILKQHESNGKSVIGKEKEVEEEEERGRKEGFEEEKTHSSF